MPLIDEVGAISKQKLLAGLDFRAPDSSSYILDRQSNTFPAQTPTPIGPENAKLCRIQVADGSPLRWLDWSTCRFAFKLKNDGTAPLKLISGPWVCFSRVRLLARGVLVHDQLFQNRETELLYRLRPWTRNQDDLNEIPWQETIPPGGFQRFVMELPFGLLKTTLFAICEYLPLTFEFECVQTPDEACVGIGSHWSLEDPVILCDVLSLDASFAQQYAANILAGQELMYPHVGSVTQMFVVPSANTNFTIQMARSYSYIKTVIITFFTDDDVTSAAPAGTKILYGTTVVPDIDLTETAADVYGAFKAAQEHQPVLDQELRMKEATRFFGPASDQANASEFSIQCIFGSHTFPAMPLKGYPQMYSSTRRALSQSCAGFTDLPRKDYFKNSFVVALNMENARSGCGNSYAAWSGASSMGGENLIVMFNGVRGTFAQGKTLRAYVTLLYDQTLKVRADGCEVTF